MIMTRHVSLGSFIYSKILVLDAVRWGLFHLKHKHCCWNYKPWSIPDQYTFNTQAHRHTLIDSLTHKCSYLHIFTLYLSHISHTQAPVRGRCIIKLQCFVMEGIMAVRWLGGYIEFADCFRLILVCYHNTDKPIITKLQYILNVSLLIYALRPCVCLHVFSSMCVYVICGICNSFSTIISLSLSLFHTQTHAVIKVAVWILLWCLARVRLQHFISLSSTDELYEFIIIYAGPHSWSSLCSPSLFVCCL